MKGYEIIWLQIFSFLGEILTISRLKVKNILYIVLTEIIKCTEL